MSEETQHTDQVSLEPVQEDTAEPDVEEKVEEEEEVEEEELPPPPKRGRPKAAPKPKPIPKKRGRPPKVMEAESPSRPEPLDMKQLTRALADHLAAEKRLVRETRQSHWNGFFA
mgnify:CR=1 FL=1